MPRKAYARSAAEVAGVEPAAQLHRPDVPELGDQQGEVGGRTHSAGPAGIAVGRVQRCDPLGAGPGEVEEHHRELAGRVAGTAVVPVQQAQLAARGGPEVVEPQVEVAGLDRFHRGEQGLEVEQLAAQGGEALGERGLLASGLGEQRVPADGADRLRGPLVRPTLGGAYGLVQGGDRGPDACWVDHRVGARGRRPSSAPGSASRRRRGRSARRGWSSRQVPAPRAPGPGSGTRPPVARPRPRTRSRSA